MSQVSTEEKLPSPADLREGPDEFLPPRRLFGWVLGYFALHVAIRTLLSSSLDLDESEQALVSQKLLLGYGPAPPLYSWLQYPFISVLGLGVFPIALLKGLILSCTFLFTYLNARFITRKHAAGAAAALALFFAPQIAWESQRDLSHTVLASSLAAATLCCFFHLLAVPRTKNYLLFGLCCGLGLLSKYNFSLWIAGLLIAACSMKEFRPILRKPRILLSVLVCLMIVLPSAFWTLNHPDQAFRTMTKLALDNDASWLTTTFLCLRNFVEGIGAFAAPVVLILLVLFYGSRKAHALPEPLSAYGQLALRAFLASLIVILVLFMIVRPTGFRERWFQPVMVVTPVLAVAFLSHRLDRIRLKRVAIAAMVVMATVLVGIPARVVLHKGDFRLLYPYDALAAQLRPMLPEDAFLVGEDNLLAGNLRVTMPQRTVLSPQLAGLIEPTQRHCILVWDARKRKLPRGELRRWAEQFEPGALDRGEPQYLTAPCKYNSPNLMTLGVMVLK